MKAEFIGENPLKVELLESGKWRLLAPLVFRSAIFGKTFFAPIGYVTDFASIPRLPIVYFLAANKIFKAAVMHDEALEHMPREQAATLFREAMIAEGVDPVLREAAYLAVKLNDQGYKPSPDYVEPQGD